MNNSTLSGAIGFNKKKIIMKGMGLDTNLMPKELSSYNFFCCSSSFSCLEKGT